MRLLSFFPFVLICFYSLVTAAQDAPDASQVPSQAEQGDASDKADADKPDAAGQPETPPSDATAGTAASESDKEGAEEAAPTAGADDRKPTDEGSVESGDQGVSEAVAPGPGSDEPSQQVPPSLTPSPDLGATSDIPDMDMMSPEQAGGRLDDVIPPSIQADEESMTAAQPVLTLHGYMRARGELQDTFWLGRVDHAFEEDEISPQPFSRFYPLDRLAECGNDCDVDTHQFANMRLRLAPQLNLSEDVRVKMMFDLFDNMVAGTAPRSFYGAHPDNDEDMPQGTTEAFASTVVPPERNNLGDSIVVKRAWAEIRNRSLGELRFGRMPNHWGLGIMNNAGNELDDDFSSEIDRLMAITKIVGIYLSASYDFMSEGIARPNDSTGLMSEMSQLDDIDQFTFTVSRQLGPEEQTSLLERGGVALNGGIYFSYREQDFFSYVERDDDGNDEDHIARLDAETFTLDGWGELRWEGLRLGYEASFTLGDIRNNELSSSSQNALDILQFGTALEFEYRLLDEKLGFHFDTGFATGDGDVTGLSSYDNYVAQQNSDTNITTFRFHPAYRIDLILWRSIMRQITGAYYFRPGINYDFIRDSFGQLFGARLNVLWSRAAVPAQTWGRDPDLGIELNLSLYWRSEDGPELVDGYHAMLQWGILFPMQGLGYADEAKTTADELGFDDLEIANALRLVLGVVY